MMEPSSNLNIDHHHLHHHQDHLHVSASSSLPLLDHPSWNQDLMLLNNNNHSDFSRDHHHHHHYHHQLMRSAVAAAAAATTQENIPMAQELGRLQWSPHGHDQDSYMPNLTSSPPPPSQDLGFHYLAKSMNIIPSLVKNEFSQLHGLHPGVSIEELGFEPMSLGGNVSINGRSSGCFSMVLPTANISSSTPGLMQPSSYPSSLGMDIQASDLLASARFGRAMSQPSLNSLALLREDLGFSSLGQLQQEPTHGNGIQPNSNGLHKDQASLSSTGATDTKRTSSMDDRTCQPPATKKSRTESRSSFTPFKVRKEKLGDRIAALQQLVAPFGKTDTASVLMEAIGYIKFLQDQVETLSVPYMRCSNNKKTRTPQENQNQNQQESSDQEGDETKPDLRSRGLCLVPLSCTSYVTNDNGGVWSPPSYR